MSFCMFLSISPCVLSWHLSLFEKKMFSKLIFIYKKAEKTRKNYRNGENEREMKMKRRKKTRTNYGKMGSFILPNNDRAIAKKASTQ